MAACADFRTKFEDGLSPMYYQGITFIPFLIAAGNEMRFGMLHSIGKVTHSCMLCAAHLRTLPFFVNVIVFSHLLTTFHSAA